MVLLIRFGSARSGADIIVIPRNYIHISLEIANLTAGSGAVWASLRVIRSGPNGSIDARRSTDVYMAYRLHRGARSRNSVFVAL